MKKLFLLTVFFIAIACGSSTPSDSDVKNAARAAILHNIKDPTSAKFHQNDQVQDLGDNTYSYSESVNATNSFGGSVAQNVFVKLKWTGNDPSEVGSYQLLDLRMENR